jgi:hypothetical protein
MSPSEVAAAMRGAFDWSAKQTARFLDDTLKVGDKAAKKALEAAGYSASQVKGAMEDVYGWTDQRVGELRRPVLSEASRPRLTRRCACR